MAFMIFRDLAKTLRNPDAKEVFFRSLSTNRRIVMWYARKIVTLDSVLENSEHLEMADRLRRTRQSLTFISNHLSYADSHVIETLMIRYGFRDLANHLIHIAGQKTYELSRRPFTRSLNTIRVFQPRAAVPKEYKRSMNKRALKWAAHLKRRGYSLLVFPEGTRSRKMRKINLNAANPKTTLYFRDSLVVPIALMGSEKIMPVGQTFPTPSTVVLRVGEPIDQSDVEHMFRNKLEGFTETDIRREMMLHYMTQINNLLDPEYQDSREH